MLGLDHVSKSYSAQEVLSDITHSFETSKTHVLIGQSGCGKTTLLRLLIGLEQPDRGQVLLEGQSLSSCDLMAVRLRIGYVIQEGGLFPHLSAADNVSLVGKYLGHSEHDMKRRIAELADLTRFPEDGLIRFPGQLSGGQRQRVSLMRALYLDPDVLLLDEPLGALDPMIRSEVRQQLKSIFAELEKTVVMVTHDLNEAAFLADDVVLLDRGRIVQRGPALDLWDQPADPFVTRFINAQNPVFGRNAE